MMTTQQNQEPDFFPNFCFFVLSVLFSLENFCFEYFNWPGDVDHK